MILLDTDHIELRQFIQIDASRETLWITGDHGFELHPSVLVNESGNVLQGGIIQGIAFFRAV